MINKIITIIVLFTTSVVIAACTPTTNEVVSPPIEDEIPENDPEEVIEDEEPEEVEEQAIELPEGEFQKMDEGDDVLIIQKGLIEIGYPIEETGTFDHETIWAITDLQLQHEDLHATGIYDEETKDVLENLLDEEISIEPGEMLEKPSGKLTDDQKILVENPYEVLALINKENVLPEDFMPHDLVIPDIRFPFVEDVPKKQMRKVAAEALEEMFEAADGDGMHLFAQSGFRAYETQDAIFASFAGQHGEDAANQFSARPGESEHQSGLTMDVTSPAVDYRLTTDFGGTEEGKWVAEHASEFGFIIRYLEGKEGITKYQYEPWHLRYVGKRAAKEIMDQGITLEEYLLEE